MLRFDRYAEEVSARIADSPSARSNRLRMYAKAYGPLLGQIAKAARILDFGCGGGEFLEFLGQHATGGLVGYDPSPSQLELARERVRGLRNVALFGDPADIPRSGYDLVFSLHVVEHVPDEQLPEYVRTVTGFLLPAGKLVIATPNGFNPFSYAYHMSADRTHLRMHSPMSLAQIVVPEGYGIQSVHRETPQVYDLMTLLKTMVWWATVPLIKLAVLSCAGGVRQHRLPFTFAPTFYAVVAKPGTGGHPSSLSST